MNNPSANDLPKELKCPYCPEGIASLVLEDVFLPFNGHGQKVTAISYRCNACKRELITTDSNKAELAAWEPHIAANNKEPSIKGNMPDKPQAKTMAQIAVARLLMDYIRKKTSK